MNNNIQEAYCSFEVSKLLKEKGFDVKQLRTYHREGETVLCPTHALAIEWIRVNFGIHINSVWLASAKFCGEITKVKSNMELHAVRGYDLPQEATEAALLYTLKNLI